MQSLLPARRTVALAPVDARWDYYRGLFEVVPTQPKAPEQVQPPTPTRQRWVDWIEAEVRFFSCETRGFINAERRC